MVLIIVYFANLFDAYYCIPKPSPHIVLAKSRNRLKAPWYALFLSRILPGLGHLYIPKPLSGFILLTITIIISLFDHLSDSLLIFLPAIAAVSAYHVYFAVPRNLSEKRQQ